MFLKKIILPLLFVPFLLPGQIPLKNQQSAPQLNGFRLSNLQIPFAEIHHGGPPKDGIPAIDNPIFISAKEALFLQPYDRVLGISIEGIEKAYPVRIMDRHEVVNDFVGTLPVAITYCPLCRSGIAFLAALHGERKTFGVSGLLYNSDVLLYDRETESLWSQIMHKAISGKASGTNLSMLPLEHTTWQGWKERHPNTLVLSMDTGFRRSYEGYHYDRYESSSALMFPVKYKRNIFPNKALIIGFEKEGVSKAYPFNALRKLKEPISDVVNGVELRVYFNKKSQSAQITDVHGNVLPAVTMFWFTWYTFHPDTEIYGNGN